MYCVRNQSANARRFFQLDILGKKEALHGTTGQPLRTQPSRTRVS